MQCSLRKTCSHEWKSMWAHHIAAVLLPWTAWRHADAGLCREYTLRRHANVAV